MDARAGRLACASTYEGTDAPQLDADGRTRSQKARALCGCLTVLSALCQWPAAVTKYERVRSTQARLCLLTGQSATRNPRRTWSLQVQLNAKANGE